MAESGAGSSIDILQGLIEHERQKQKGGIKFDLPYAREVLEVFITRSFACVMLVRMMMFEVLQGDVFDRAGTKLVVFKLRIEVAGDMTRMLVHFVEDDEVRIRPAEMFMQMIAKGLESGDLTNINRPADFALQ